MKVVVATPLYPPEGGGPATFAASLAAELPKRGWEVNVVKFSAVRHLPKLARHLSYLWHVFKAARKADLVLALDPVSTGLPALIAARMARKPFYLRVSGDYAWEQGTARFGVTDTLETFVCRKDYAIPVRILKGIQSFVAQATERVVVPGEYLAQVVALWEVHRSCIRVVYNPGPAHIPETKALLEPPYVVTIARLVPTKGMDKVIEAFAEIAKEDEKVQLVIVGEGPERERLEGIKNERGLGSRITFAGNVPHGQIFAWLAHAEAFVLNSRYECMSHLILESFAVGTPVLTSDIRGNKELARDGETALLFPYNDVDAIAERMREVRRNAKLRKRITTAAKKLAASFTEERMVDEIIEALSV